MAPVSKTQDNYPYHPGFLLLTYGVLLFQEAEDVSEVLESTDPSFCTGKISARSTSVGPGTGRLDGTRDENFSDFSKPASFQGSYASRYSDPPPVGRPDYLKNPEILYVRCSTCTVPVSVFFIFLPDIGKNQNGKGSSSYINC